jgi:hypothetical protein
VIRWLAVALLLGLTACVSAPRRAAPFVGVVAGVSTLSADGRTTSTPAAFEASLYKPENGPAVNLLAGVHVTDYLSAQANYVWNRNTVTTSAVRVTDLASAFVEERRRGGQHAFLADVLLYFRSRTSWARPYLSAGAGVVRFETGEPALLSSRGPAERPSAVFESTSPALRVAVGIDVGSTAGWSFRYSFSETIGRNPVSPRLSPPGQRNLANFQNLFGVVRTF